MGEAERVVWIGPGDAAKSLRDIFVSSGVEFLQFDNVDAALHGTSSAPLSAAVVSADWGQAAEAIQQVISAHPGVQVLAATKLGVPVHLSLVLQRGASSVLDLKAKDHDEIQQQLQEALRRHRQITRQRELLSRIYELNEEFLKNIVLLEKRNVELVSKFQNDGGAQENSNSESPRRILVIDDEPSICQLFEIVLKDSGYEVIVAGNGEQAIEAFRDKSFDIVITDKNLPGMSGLDVMREIKQLRPDSDVIMITGYASKESAMEALNRGATAYLEKPFDDLDQVVEKVHQVAQRQQEKGRQRDYLQQFKERNRSFLEQYRVVRAGLEHTLKKHQP